MKTWITVVAAFATALCVARGDAVANDRERERAIASEFGFDAEDSTEALQRAIDSGAATVVVDKQDSPWIVRPIELRSDLTLVFEEGVEVIAKKGEFLGGADALFRATRCKNLTLRGEGSGATLRMRKRDYWSAPYKLAEWRHGVSLLSVENTTIENLQIAETGGDGVYVGVAHGAGPCRNVVLRRLDCVENNRQGISVISADGLLIEDCVLRNTNGTAPEAGIDFEPNHGEEQITNVVLRRVRSFDNAGDGFAFYLPNLRATGKELTVLAEDCVAARNARAGLTFTTANGEGKTLSGSTTFRGFKLIGNRSGVAVRSKASVGGVMTFDRMRIVTSRADVATNGKELGEGKPRPDFVEGANSTTDAGISIIAVGTDEIANGGIEFKDVEIVDFSDASNPTLLATFRDASSEGVGFEQISGSIRSTLVDETNAPRATIETRLDAATLATLFPDLAARRVPAWDLKGLTDASNATSRELADAWRAKFQRTPQPSAVFRARGDADYWFYAEKDQRVEWTIRRRTIGSYPPTKLEWTITEPDGSTSDGSREFVGSPERFEILATSSGWRRFHAEFGASTLEVVDATAPMLTAARPSLNVFGTQGTFEFYVPQDARDLGVRIVGSAAERATARIFDPTGAEVAVLENVDALGTWSVPIDAETERPVKPLCGFWRIAIEKPTVGVLEDYVLSIFGAPALLR